MTSPSMDLRDRLQLTLGAAYAIERELGGGGMSRVFRAHDDTLGRDVVIKVLTSELAQELSAERFEREVRVTAQLQHPHIVPVITSGVTDAQPYYVMPFVAGESLRAHLGGGTRLDGPASVKVLAEVARALDYAHRRGVVHRDIKPENILLSDGIAVVTDFGIAKAINAAKTVAPGSALTQLGTSIGTPAYMAPEQAAGDPATDHRADIYAWGVVAYELLSGHHPFASRTSPQQLLAAHMSELPAPLRRAAPGVSPALATLVMRCLEKDPIRRPDSAAALVEVMSTQQSQSGFGGNIGWRRAVAAGVVLLTIAAIGGIAWRWRESVGGAAPLPGAHTLAVLPFANLSGDTTQQYFADGLADELTTALGRTPGLRVTARSAAFAPALRSLDAMAAGRRLDVATVLEGAVRRSGPRIRLSAELVGVHDGAVLWSDEFEHDGGDVFAAQDDLTHRVAAALHDRLAVARARATSFDRGTSDEVAYDLYLQARYLFARRGTANLLHAAALLAQAIHRDSTFARAMATLAMVQVVLPEYTQLSAVSATTDGQQTRDTMITAGLRNAARAIARDSTLADAYVAQGYGLIARWDWDGSETSFRRALALEPLNPEAHHWHADLLYARGDIDGALNEQRRAQQLDPTAAIVVAEVANELYDKHLYAEAIATGHRSSAMDPLLGFSYLNYAPAFIFMGYPDSAMDALATAQRLDGGGQDQQGVAMRAAIRAAALTRLKRNDEARQQVAIVEAMVKSGGSAYTAALARMGIGDREGALRWLTRSIDAREEAPASWGVSCDPMFDPLKSDPRFGMLMARMKVHVCPPEQG
jgi:eukaryotic-like serine/threonine-protein kinase